MKLPPGYVPGAGLPKASAYGGFGQRMLQQMGWKDGEGLGLNKTGMAKALDVKKKEDTKGVGAGASFAWSQRSWEQAYTSALQNVGEGASSDSSDSDASSDDEFPAQEPPKREVARLANRDGTLSSAKPEEHRVVAELGREAWGRFGGRQGKLDRIRQQEAKLAEQAAALLLGRQKTSAAPGGLNQEAPRQIGSPSEESTETAAAEEPPRKKRKRAQPEATEGSPAQPEQPAAAGEPSQQPSKKKAKKAKRAAAGDGTKDTIPALTAADVAELATDETAAGGKGSKTKAEKRAKKGKKKHAGEDAGGADEPEPSGGNSSGSPAEAAGSASAPRTNASEWASVGVGPQAWVPTPAGWWGAKRFVSAGTLGGLEDVKVSNRERRAFDEDDQAQLYMAAQNAKTAGKQGLGKGKGSGVIAGAKWEGTKTVFADEPSQRAAAGSGAEPSQPAAGTDAEPALPAEQEGGKAAAPKRIKWKALATEVLKQAGGKALKVQRLHARVLKRVRDIHGDCRELAAADEQAFLAKIGGSSKFEVMSGKVSLKK